MTRRLDLNRGQSRRWVRGALFAACALLAALPAQADPNAREKAAAEALFQQGTELAASDLMPAACMKFEASQELDPALGTMLRLADCYDRTGKSASAWALFRESASLAAELAQAERQQIATRRAEDLERRLSKLQIQIDAKRRPDGLEVRLNGVRVPEASWDTPIPVDPGIQQLEVIAPGRRTWATEVDVAKGPSQQAVGVPLLAKEPAQTSREPRAIVWKAEAPESRGGTQRAFGWITSGLGLLGLAAGGYLGYRAYDLNQKSLDECRKSDPNACTPEGKRQRDDAQDFALGSTIGFAAGGVLVATGVTLLLSAPSSERSPRAAQRGLRLHASALPSSARFSLETDW